MLKSDLNKTPNWLNYFIQKGLKRLKNGTQRLKVSSGTNNMQQKLTLEIGHLGNTNAMYVTHHLYEKQPTKDSALTIANLNSEEYQGSTISKENAVTAASNLHATNIQECKLVAIHVLPILGADLKNVHDLTVEDCHEYFANGVLVHNCMDCGRYIAFHLRRIGIIKNI